MLSVIRSQSGTQEFFRFIGNQFTNKNYVLKFLELENIQNNEENLIISDELVNRYLNVLSRYLNRYGGRINLKRQHAKKQGNELQKGHLAKYEYLFQKQKYYILPDNSENENLSCEINELELEYLIEKVKRNFNANYKTVVKNQLLKKIHFNNLFQLISLDIEFEQEIKDLNAYLKDNNFLYEIYLPREIIMMHRETSKLVKLSDLELSERFTLHLLLLKRDENIIKMNFQDNFFQVLLIDQIDYLCNFNAKLINNLLNIIINSLINSMNMQVITTSTHIDLLNLKMLQVSFELKHDLRRNQTFLQRYQNDSYLEEKISHFHLIEAARLQKEINDLKEVNEILNYENRNSNEELKTKIAELEKSLQAEQLKRVELDLLLQEKKANVSIDSPNIAKRTTIHIEGSDKDGVNNFINELNKKTEIEKNDVKILIKKIQNSIDNLNELAREMICGSLKNLVCNLYTHSNFYLYELIQNFEDNSYDEGVDGKVKIIIDKNYILFANNEIGFTPKNFKSICCLSVSEKSFNTHIGHKGIGFKSVFLCTDNPIVISKKIWKFEFKVQNQEELLDYITPYFVEDENVPKELQVHLDDKNYSTFFFLPFKKSYDVGKIDFVKTFDPNILLFMDKIREIQIEDRIKGEKVLFKSEGVKDLKLYKDNEVYNTFRVFKTNENIVIAFPMDDKKRENYYVYSVFPIYDLKINFLISAHWCLTTNRESISEYNVTNIELKKCVLDFIIEIFKKDNQISEKKMQFLPTMFQSISSPWWHLFMSELTNKIKEALVEEFKKKRIYNENLSKLVDFQHFKHLDIEVFQDLNNEKTLEGYGIKKLTIEDLLLLLESNNEKLQLWKNQLNEEWWKRFYEYIGSNLNEIKSKKMVFNSKIFLISDKRQSLCEKKYFLKSEFDSECLLKIHHAEVINYKSIEEKNFIRDYLEIKEITKPILMELILKDRLYETVPRNTFTLDLDFIKINIEIYKAISKTMTLCVPIKNGKATLIENSMIPTLFSYDLTSLTIENENFIDFLYSSFEECLNYEILLIKLGCKLPTLNRDVLKDNKKFQVLKSFESYSSNDIELVYELFNIIPKNIVDFLPIAPFFIIQIPFFISVAQDKDFDKDKSLIRPNNAKRFSSRKFDEKLNAAIKRLKGNEEGKLKIGIAAEYWLYEKIQEHYYYQLNLNEFWISNFRTLFFESTINCDDSKGYDFVLKDTKNFFGFQDKTCFIEVKGFANKCQSKFHLTNNEKIVYERTISMKDSVYLIVLIENVSDLNQIEVAEVINWTANPDRIQINYETFICEIKK